MYTYHTLSCIIFSCSRSIDMSSADEYKRMIDTLIQHVPTPLQRTLELANCNGWKHLIMSSSDGLCVCNVHVPHPFMYLFSRAGGPSACRPQTNTSA